MEMLSRWASINQVFALNQQQDKSICIESTTGPLPVVVRDQMLRWKDDPSGEVLGGGGRRQEISQTLKVTRSNFVLFSLKNIGVLEYTATLIDIYSQMVAQVFRYLWQVVSQEVGGDLVTLFSSLEEMRYLSQIYIAQIFVTHAGCDCAILPPILQTTLILIDTINTRTRPTWDWMSKGKTKHFTQNISRRRNIFKIMLSQGWTWAA